MPGREELTLLAEILDQTENERIILTHVTRRTNLGEARRILTKVLPKSIYERMTFLMSWKNVPED